MKMRNNSKENQIKFHLYIALDHAESDSGNLMCGFGYKQRGISYFGQEGGHEKNHCVPCEA